MKTEFLITVIMPIYNVDRYLEESINSVINQSIGFDNIQLILVNDGSLDNSEEICLKYREKYPNNIIYIKQKNKGVSSARNRGIEEAQASYISFLDADDKWDPNAFELGIQFLNDNPIIDLVSFPMVRFGGKDGNHYLNYKFNGVRRISIVQSPDYIQNSVSSTIIRSSMIKDNNIRLDPRLKISEDMVFVSQIIMPKLLYGTVGDANYYYRVREDSSSAIDNSIHNHGYYNETLHIGWKKIIDESIRLHGHVIDYVQACILYEFKWRTQVSSSDSILSKEDWKEYLSDLKSFLQYVEDSTVFKMRFFSQQERENYFMFKYGDDLVDILRIEEEKIFIGNNVLCKVSDLSLTIDNIVATDDKVTLYGRNFLPISYKENEVFFTDNLDNKYFLKYYDVPNKMTYQNVRSSNVGFKIEVKVNKRIEYIYPTLNIGADYQNINLKIINQSKLSSTFSSLFLIRKKYILKYLKKEKKIFFYKNHFIKRVMLELKCHYNLLKKKKIKSYLYRVLANISKIINFREVWIISDRIDAANDNGEAFFTYMMENKKKINRKVFFAISKESPDFKRMKKIGRVVDVNSLRYKWLFFKAKYIISSHIETIVDNPFGRGELYLKDLYPKYNIFLQHGITKDDLSPWLNINSKKIDLFVTSSKPEYDSLFDCKYNFEKENVILTGLPRYDKLEKKHVVKEVLLMPTWRRSLAAKVDQKTGKRSESSEFLNSQYYEMYNGLINNEKLLLALEKHNYKLRFVPHNNMHQYIKDFTKQKNIIIQHENVNYSKLFSESAVLVTDFSSVAFDFGYLRKPLVYFQFDKDSFYKEQIYDIGYFDYEKTGLGPVKYDLDSVVDWIVETIENNAKLKPEYEKRINDFFTFNDSNNSERVYNEIIKLK